MRRASLSLSIQDALNKIDLYVEDVSGKMPGN